jgi:hypothetical protein
MNSSSTLTPGQVVMHNGNNHEICLTTITAALRAGGRFAVTGFPDNHFSKDASLYHYDGLSPAEKDNYEKATGFILSHFEPDLQKGFEKYTCWDLLNYLHSGVTSTTYLDRVRSMIAELALLEACDIINSKKSLVIMNKIVLMNKTSRLHLPKEFLSALFVLHCTSRGDTQLSLELKNFVSGQPFGSPANQRADYEYTDDVINDLQSKIFGMTFPSVDTTVEGVASLVTRLSVKSS